MAMAWWLLCGALALLAYVLARGKDPAPIFGVYTRPGRWYYLKYAVFAAIYYFRKYAHRSSGAGAGARAGQGVRAFADPVLMDHAQPLSDHPKAFDAVFFIAAASAPDSDQGVYVMMGCERRPLGMANGLFYIGLPGEGLLCSAKLPDTVLFGAGSAEFGAEGMRMAPVEPMKRWTLNYQGPMRFQKDPTRVVQAMFSGEWAATSAHFDFDCDLHAPAVIRSIAREPWSRQYFDGLKTAHQSHYEQFGTLRWSLTLDGGAPLRFSLPSFRDHSFGARRDWALMRRYAFHHIFLDDGTSAAVGVVCQPSTATNFEVGVVALPDGRVLAARAVALPLWQHGERGVPPTDYGFSFQADQLYHVQVVVEHAATHYVSAEWEARMEERFCRYVVNGVPGRGTSEFHYRRVGGRPARAAAADPEWYRDMCRTNTTHSKLNTCNAGTDVPFNTTLPTDSH